MSIVPRTGLPSAHDALPHLYATRDAFDSVAADYDGPRGNNALIRDMRAEVWRTLDATFAPDSRLLDIGCGTGLDAVRLARRGHHVTATDWSSRMVERARARAEHEQVASRVRTLVAGAHELDRLGPAAQFDGAYSNLGALNCVPDLPGLAAQVARLLKPGGALVFAIIGSVCPWEIAYYASRRDWRRISVRFAGDMVPVGLNKRVVWTRYYAPRRFHRAFSAQFALQQYRGLCLFAPPPYLTGFAERHADWYHRLWRLDRLTAGWPVLRNMGDHFLMVMRRR